MECYIKTKERIAENQTEDEVCVLNYEDEVLRDSVRRFTRTCCIFPAEAQRPRTGIWTARIFTMQTAVNGQKVINVNELNILGTHNYENVMAAVGMR